ncbi:MFS transporter, YQGE family, putative transporter [Marininema mesophilum]|uniref:MFS transporter, YQGE family, putative transporter n=1 Tax=Marininema mesophilum TaxID=1048340 RepID=A0A1H2VGW5_9BACL|nr:MFS transporter [Marininema mesophilum]SDW67571.1 MFS transporter, YQGE family, putative transporter [Marininema mesophilum]
MRLFGNTNRLDRSAWLLLMISGLFAVSTALSNIFVNVYFWKIKNDFGIIGQFNTANYLWMAITFIFAGRLAKQVDRVITIRIGVVLLAAFYLSVLLMGKDAVNHVFFLGSFLGIGSGFFWLSFNVLYFEITEKYNRDIFNGFSGLFTSLSGIIAPSVSGWIITRINHFTGYRIIFTLSLLVFLAAVAVSFMLQRRSASGRYRLFDVLKLCRKRENHWFWVNLSMIGQGMREGLFGFLTSLLFYVATRDELALGSYLTVSSFFGLLSYFIVGRYMRIRWRDESILFGTVMLGIVSLPLLWDINAWTLAILGVGSAFFYPIYMVPLTSAVFDVIGETQETAKYRVEYVVARELALNTGRLFAVLVFLWWVIYMPTMVQLRWLVVPFSFVQMFTWLMIRKVPLLEQE